MNKPLYNFFTTDHRRIEEFLDKAVSNIIEINLEYYHLFRGGLLRHIKMEEKILFPAAIKANKEMIPEIIPKLRLEHGALTALMVPPPTSSLIKVIRYVLEKHDLAEEQPGGLYEICEDLTQGQTIELLKQLSETPEVPIHPCNPAPFALESAKRSLVRANYNYDEIVNASVY